MTDTLTILAKIDALAAIDLTKANAPDLGCAIGGIRYWIIQALGQQSKCAEATEKARQAVEQLLGRA